MNENIPILLAFGVIVAIVALAWRASGVGRKASAGDHGDPLLAGLLREAVSRRCRPTTQPRRCRKELHRPGSGPVSGAGGHRHATDQVQAQVQADIGMRPTRFKQRGSQDINKAARLALPSFFSATKRSLQTSRPGEEAGDSLQQGHVSRGRTGQPPLSSAPVRQGKL